MEIKEKIYSVLNAVAPTLKSLKDDYYIIGASALALADINIASTFDIDILLTTRDALYLQRVWKSKLIKNPIKKDSELFRSTFSRYNFETLDIEAMGDLEVHKNGVWKPLKINRFKTIMLENMEIKIPTLDEQLRILNFFGRKKDLERIELISNAANQDYVKSTINY